MAILATFEKQSGETQDYDISFVDWLDALEDTAVSHVCTTDDGIELISSSLIAGVVKAWLSGGISGKKYKVTAVITTATAPPRVKEAEIIVAVKDY